MTDETMWTNTHKALDGFFKILTCKKCNKPLCDAKQYLNCGHYACAECVSGNSNCVQCNLPGKACDIHSDSELKDLFVNLNIISEAVGFNVCKSNVVYNDDNQSLRSNKRVLKPTSGKQANKKVIQLHADINETLNTSICESTFSKTSSKGKVNANIPKNINKKNRKGETALHTACRNNNIERVKVLLNAGAIPNTKDNAGWTPLQEAASSGFYEVCELLLNAGASPDTPALENRTALHEAVIGDNYDLASLLLKCNSSRNVYDNIGKKPIDYCKSHKMANLFKTLQNITENKSDTVSESSKLQDFNKSMNQTVVESKILLYGSDLQPRNRKLLTYLGAEKKAKIANNFSRSVSHVIFDTDVTGNIRLTYDVLISIMYGKKLLSSDCLSVLSESNNIEVNDLDIFELNPPQLLDGPIRARENIEKQNPGLFDNCHFYFAIKMHESIKYDDMNITKEQLMKLTSAGDGVILTREPKPEDIQGSLSPFHVAHDSAHSLHKCTHYIIYTPENSNTLAEKVMYQMPFLKSLPLMWFIESILRFRLIDPIDFGIST